MPVYMVHCALRDPERNRDALDATLATLDECIRPMPDTWIVEDATSAGLLYTMLRDHLTPEDRVVITRLGREAEWQGIEGFAGEWMADRFTRTQ